MKSPLLIHPPPYPMPDPGEWQSLSDFIPMGLLYLAEACRARGHEPVVVQLLDAAATISRMEGGSTWSPDRWKHFLARLLEEMRPRAVGIQCHWSYHSAGAIAVARWTREIDPEIHITIGGVHAGAFGPAFLEAVPEIDAVVIGDGDAAYPALLDAVARGDGDPVPGAVCRGPDGSIRGVFEASPPPTDAVPVLSFDPALIWPEGRGRYVGLPFMRGRCPKPCTFCSLNSERLYPVLERSLSRQLEAQLPAMIERRVPLYLPEHFAGPKPLELLADALEQTGPASVVLVDVHPGMINPRAAAALTRIQARSERLRMWLGVESGAESVRGQAGRDITDAEILTAFDVLKEVGIDSIQSSIMMGLPGEGEDEVMASDRMMATLNERGVLTNVLPVVAFPETALYRDPDRFGLSLRMREVSDFDALSLGWHAPIEERYISCESTALDAAARVEATLKLRLRQRDRLGYRVSPELFRTMEHLPGLRVPGEAEAMTERYASYLDGPRFGGAVRPDRFWSPE